MNVIKPEDVPPEFTEMVEEKFISYYDGPLADVAAILNAAIKAGIVSPPVKCVRFASGKLATLKPHSPVLYKGSEVFDDPADDVLFEHWKGQTE